MARGGSDGKKGIRKKTRANNMGLQWWRKLSLPRRGKKDSLLEPAPLTESQRTKLESRQAALLKAVSAPRVTRQKHLASATWDPSRNLAKVTTPRGNSLQSMGCFIDGAQYLYPEEALYLVDRGTLDLCIDGLPASVHRTWVVAISAKNALSLEEYLTFSHLRRCGYVVRRYERHENDSRSGPKVALSAWKVGSYKRKDGPRPLFHIAVFRYEDAPPTIDSITRFLDSTGKTRLKFALIDRGVVVLTDVATNATPLSERFLRRLPLGQQEVARRLQSGDAGGLAFASRNIAEGEMCGDSTQP